MERQSQQYVDLEMIMKQIIIATILTISILLIIGCRKPTLYNLNFVDNPSFEHMADDIPDNLTLILKGNSKGSFYLKIARGDGRPVNIDKYFFGKGIIDTTISRDWYSQYLKGTITTIDNDVNDGYLKVWVFL